MRRPGVELEPVLAASKGGRGAFMPEEREVGTAEPAREIKLPDVERASRADIRVTLEELSRANTRLALLNRVSTRLLIDPAASISDLCGAIALEIGAEHFFYQLTDRHLPDQLLLVAASDQNSELEAKRASEFLLAVSRSGPIEQEIVLDSAQLAESDAYRSAAQAGLLSFMRIPLLAQDRLLGAVSFASLSRPMFPEADQELVRTFGGQLAAAVERQRLELQLRESEQIYRGAVITGRLASWETNMVTRERIWTQEGMEMFGLDLPNGRGVVGGPNDEYWLTLHPEDRHKVAEFHRTADILDSYPAEYRILRSDGRLMWMSGRGRVVERGPDGKARRVANMVVDVTERKRNEERTRLLIDELNHRVKNTLATVQAIIAQTLKGGGADPAIRGTLEARLQSLSRSHDLLTKENWEGADLREVVHEALRPFVRPDDDRKVRVEGQSLRLRPKATLSLGMAFHELATNASKYGALSSETGTILVRWATVLTEGSPHIELLWEERGGPPVHARPLKGFGSRLLEQGLPHELGGKARLEYLPQGVNCRISFPLPRIDESMS